MPDLENLYQDYRARGLRVVGVWTYATGHSRNVGVHAAASFPIGLPLGEGANELRAMADEGISWFPFHVLVDASGRIAYHSREYDATALDAAVAPHLRPDGR